VTGSNTTRVWIAGGTDTRTPPSETSLIGSVYADKATVLPGATHTPVLSSPLASDPTKNCGQVIAEGFFEHGTVDDTCRSELLSPLYDSSFSSHFANGWWGTTDDWGDGTPPPAGPQPRIQAPPVRINLSFASRLALESLRRRSR
jgi:hypothetical protein